MFGTNPCLDNPFDFFDQEPSDELLRNSFVVNVPAEISSKSALLASFAAAGKFPDYFGGNWDALLDCLRDFDWIGENQIIIKHGDLPLRASPTECRTYLEILHEAVNDWARTPAQMNLPVHELRVLFPAGVRSDTKALLASENVIRRNSAEGR